MKDAKAALAGAEANTASSQEEDLHLVCTSAQRMCKMMVAGDVVMEIIPTVQSLEFCRAQGELENAASEEQGEEQGEVVPIGDYLSQDIPEGV